MWYANRRGSSETRSSVEYPTIETNWNASPFRNEKGERQANAWNSNPPETWDFGPLLEYFGA